MSKVAFFIFSKSADKKYLKIAFAFAPAACYQGGLFS